MCVGNCSCWGSVLWAQCGNSLLWEVLWDLVTRNDEYVYILSFIILYPHELVSPLYISLSLYTVSHLSVGLHARHLFYFTLFHYSIFSACPVLRSLSLLLAAVPPDWAANSDYFNWLGGCLGRLIYRGGRAWIIFIKLWHMTSGNICMGRILMLRKGNHLF